MNFPELIQTILIYALPVVFAITLHEAAHGYVAHKLGDNTAWMLGRVTLNPVPHIDPLGTIAVPALLYLASGGNFLFGYARPVPVRFGNLNHPKRDMIWVALAGPAINFFQALAWLLAFYLMKHFGVTETYFLKMSLAGVVVNVSMFVFNLFPLPPLDGGRVLVGLLPWRAAVWLSKVEPYGMYIILGLVAFKLLDGICAEAAELLRDQVFSAKLSDVLRKMKPTRQVECVELMISANNITIPYAEALLAASPAHFLVGEIKPKKVRGVNAEQMLKMEREMGNLQEQYKLVEESYGQDVLNLVLAKGYLVRLIENNSVARYIQQNQPDVFTEFVNIVETVSLDK